MSVSITFPCKDEKKRIVTTLEKYLASLPPDYEYIIIDNGSTDGTKEYFEQAYPDHPQVKYFWFEKPLGKGGAVYAGLERATNDIIGFADPDGATPPTDYQKLVEGLKEVDVTLGSRYIKGAIIKQKQPIYRRMGSRVYNTLIRLILGLHVADTQCGFKVMRREVFQAIRDHVTIMNYAFDVELLYLAQRKGFNIREIPVVWDDQSEAEFNPFKSGYRMVIDLIKIRLTTK